MSDLRKVKNVTVGTLPTAVFEKYERNIYSFICNNDGVKASEISSRLGIEKKVVNQMLYNSPYMHDLCYVDGRYRWHGLVRQTRPHYGIGEFSGYYSTVKEFMDLDERTWLESLKHGCEQIGRNLNDTRGLIHSFLDARATMRALFDDLEEIPTDDWEIVFELRIKRARHIRIYADVLVITDNRAFSLEFKMKNIIDPEEVLQTVKYTKYIEILFGMEYDVIPALVLTGNSDLYTYVPIGNTSAELPVCSGDMLFNLFDEYLGFLKK